jgi:thioredoxin-like negative regulator of GroEL
MVAQKTTEVYAKNKPANDEKVIAFGQRLAKSFYEEESTFFLDNFNIQSFAKKVVSVDEDIEEKDVLKKFNQIFKHGFYIKFEAFPQKIKNSIAKGASYDIVNYYYHLDERKYHLLFRLFSENGGLNYHDYQLSFDEKDESFQLADVFVYTVGEYLSETYQDLYLLNVPSKDPSDIATNKERFKSAIFFTRYNSLINNEKYEQAFNLINKLTGEFTKKKIYFITKINIAAGMNKVFEMEALDELLKNFPNDPTTKLMALDYYVMLKDYNAVMKILDDIQATTEDTFIEFMRGNAAWKFEDYELAEKAYANTVREYPNFENAKLNLMYLYDELEKHEDNIVLLNSMIESNDYDKKDLIEFIDDKSNKFKNLPNAGIYNRWKRKK